jgi:hypothetical protein
MDWTDKIIVMGVGITEKQEKQIKEIIVNKVTEEDEYQSSEEYPNQWADEEALAYNYGLDEEDKNYG